MQKKSISLLKLWERRDCSWGKNNGGIKKHHKMVFIIYLLAIITGCSHTLNGAQQKDESKTKKKVIKPWKWQDKYGFVQANEVKGIKRMLFCAGQISVDHEGKLLYPGGMEKQLLQIARNLETIFKKSDLKLSDIVRITYYTTDIKGFTKASLKVFVNRLKEWGCKPATSLIGISNLARKDCLIELEVTAISSK